MNALHARASTSIERKLERPLRGRLVVSRLYCRLQMNSANRLAY